LTITTDSAASTLATAVRSFEKTPPLHTLGDLSLSDAYRIQELVYADLHGDPARASGYKISLVAPEHRAGFGATEPTFGRLSEAQLVEGSPTIELRTMHCPLVEPELVFILDEDLPLGATAEQVKAASRVAAGFEIPDSRYVGWFPVPEQTVQDLVADNSFAGLVVHDAASVPASEVDLSQVRMDMYVDDEHVGTGHGSDVYGDPANAVAWLSEVLARDGVPLRAGARISAGTFLWPPVAKVGTFRADYSGIGTVVVHFA
jgi:2-keto-4-pentenoate hydratase